MKSYLEIAQDGKNDWWRYLLSLFFILFMWLFVGSIPLVVAILAAGLDNLTFDANGISGIDPLLMLILTLASFLPFFLATPLAVRFIHARPMRTLVTPEDQINWRRLLLGGGIWFAVSMLISLVESLLHPGRYVLTIDIAIIAPFVVVILLLIPFQTSAEELFFRGYLIQWVGLKLKNPVALSLISGLLFALPHILNPEVSVDFWLTMSGYFLFGAFAAWITLKDNGLELALGMHAANNLYTSIVANYTVSALPTPSIFTIGELDAAYNLVALPLGMVVFYFIAFVSQNGILPHKETV